MHRARHVAPSGPYPWETLEILPRRAVNALRSARWTLGRWPVSPLADRVAALLSAAVGADCEVIPKELRGVHRTAGEQVAQLRFVQTGLAIDVAVESALAADLVSRLVGRPLRVPPTSAEAGESNDMLAGAFAALTVDLARRCNGPGRETAAEPVRLRGSRLAPDFVAEQVFTVLVEGRPYSATIRFSAPDRPSARTPATLDTVNPHLRVRLGLVVGLSWVPREELSTLRRGDVWIPTQSPSQSPVPYGRDDILALEMTHGGLRGRCALASPEDDRGFSATLEGANTLVVGGSLVALPVDVDEGAQVESPVADEQPKKPGLEDAVLNAPVVVRVELGSVGMTVQEWSELRAGDVIQCGKRVGAPADLRVGGAVVARGELVNVEGELGVRISELVGAPDPRNEKDADDADDADEQGPGP